jgi:FlgD Ig-like domain
MAAGAHRSPGRAPSRAAVAIVLILLAATAAAFVYTERQKLTRGLVTRPAATHFVSPTCACETATAAVSFRLSEPRTATVRIQRENGRTVRTLTSREPFAAGTVRLEWDGRAESGELVRDGRYRVAIDFAGEDSSFVFPQPIVVDTVSPTAVLVRAAPSPVPAGEAVIVTYQLSEPGRPLLAVDGVEVLQGRRGKQGKLTWAGPPGTHELTVAALDLAGNVGPPSAPAVVVVQP